MSRSMRSMSSAPPVRQNPMDISHKSFCFILLKNLYLSAYYPEGLSFLALILITARLYDVNKEISFLSYMSSFWLPPIPSKEGTQDPSSEAKSRTFHIENLRQDFDILMVELWSSRTTLILSVIFVLIYIFSWAWMAYAVRETRNVKDVSLTTVLLLAVFAAIDIAASAGFVMVRIIMLFIRDHNFPKDMRIPDYTTEHDQITAIAALRMAVLKSSPGNTDVFVSVIIGFLTGLRVYSVVCAVSFYNKVRKGEFNASSNHSVKERSVIYCTDNSSERFSSHLDEFFKRSAPYLAGEDPRRKERSKDRNERRYSTTNSTSITDIDNMEKEMKIQAADMPMHMQRKALQITAQACSIYTTEKLIAESIKQDFDAAFEPTWHCIVGRNWGSCVTHSKQCYIRILYRDLTILLYKST